MSSTGLHSLATIIKRLEAATSRLEDLAVTPGGQPAAAPSKPAHAASTSATPAPPAHIPAAAPPAPAAASSASEDKPSVRAYDEAVIEGALKPWLALTNGFAAQSVKDQAKLVERMFANQRTLLVVAANVRQPEQAKLEELLKPLQVDIGEITKAKETNRKDREWFNHLSVVAEGAPAVGWVAGPKPGPYVKEIADSTQFWANRVIKEFKDKDPKHIEWAKGYVAILNALQNYVKAEHTTGLAWNAKGVSASEFTPPSSGAAAGAPPPPPPPPGPPPPPPPPPAGASATPTAGGIGAVFSDLNRGADVTKGLRKVDKSEMTHKNPALREQGPATPSPPAAGAKRPAPPRKPQSLQMKKPAKFALEGNKWLVEYQEGETVTVDKTEISQTVNLFGVKSSTIIIKGKVNAVTLVNCTKTSVLVESVISSISVTSSPSFTVQITGAAPTIQLDTTDVGQIFLSKACLETVEIVTSKCSSINVSLPVEGEEEGVFEEKPVPEMLRTVVKGGKLVTTVVEHTG